MIRELIDKGRTWIKLSGAYINSVSGPPAYGDVARTAQAFVQAAPERVVWGSDWPHPSETERKPDDVMEHAFDWLDAPLQRVAGKDVPLPYAANLEQLAIPQVADIVAAAKEVTYR